MLGFRQTSVHVFYFWFIRLHLPRRMNLFLFPLHAPRTRKRPPRAPTSPRKSPHGSCSANDNAHRRTRNRPPCPLPAHRVPESNHPEHDRREIIARNRPRSPPRNPTKSPICVAGESSVRQFIQQTRHFIQRPPESFAPHRRLPTFALSSRQQRNTNQKIEDNEKSNVRADDGCSNLHR